MKKKLSLFIALALMSTSVVSFANTSVVPTKQDALSTATQQIKQEDKNKLKQIPVKPVQQFVGAGITRENIEEFSLSDEALAIGLKALDAQENGNKQAELKLWKAWQEAQVDASSLTRIVESSKDSNDKFFVNQKPTQKPNQAVNDKKQPISKDGKQLENSKAPVKVQKISADTVKKLKNASQDKTFSTLEKTVNMYNGLVGKFLALLETQKELKEKIADLEEQLSDLESELSDENSDSAGANVTEEPVNESDKAVVPSETPSGK